MLLQVGEKLSELVWKDLVRWGNDLCKTVRVAFFGE